MGTGKNEQNLFFPGKIRNENYRAVFLASKSADIFINLPPGQTTLTPTCTSGQIMGPHTPISENLSFKKALIVPPVCVFLLHGGRQLESALTSCSENRKTTDTLLSVWNNTCKRTLKT